MSHDEMQLEENEKNEDPGVSCTTVQLLFFGVVCCGIITGVGCIAYFVPDRTCVNEFPATEPPVSSEAPITEAPITEAPVPSTEEPIVSTVPPVWDGRLDPNVTTPLSYALTLQPCLGTECGDAMRFRFYGWVDIVVEVWAETSEIIMHMVDIEIVSITVKALNGDDTDLLMSWSEYKFYQYLKISTAPLMRGTNYTVSIEYIGNLQEGLAGFYRSSYTNAAGDTVWLATSQMQPTDARRALPCWDEPGFRSYFDTTIIHLDTMTALSNGEEVGTEPEAGMDGWSRTVFKTTPKMPTYLLAFVVSDFVFKEVTTTNGIRFRVYSRPEAIESAYYGLDQGDQILTYFEEYFDTPYPLDKQDMVAIPDFAAGAMENWGLILYRETALLYNEEENSESNKQRVAVVVSHELAHQWFGNLVTPEWWDDLWLNEGFASYVEYLGVNFTEPSWKMMEQFLVDDLQSVFVLDALGSSHPVKVPVNSPAEINEIFDTISYAKGASIIRMLNNILSEETFQAGITGYLAKYSEGNANSDKLWASLNEVQDQYDVKTIMDTWTLQMGYPVITLTRTGTTLTATQQHFLIDPNTVVDDKYGDLGYLWYCQLTYAHQTEREYDNPPFVWLNATETVDFELSNYNVGDWFLINIKQYNFYRVNYPSETWAKLAEQLDTDLTQIPNENRAALIDDAFNLARSGMIEYDIAMDLTKYLNKELEYIPWEATLTVFEYIRDMFSRNAGYGDLETYMLCQIQSLYDSVGFQEKEGDTHLDIYNRVNAIRTACYYGNEDCLSKATQELSEYMADEVDERVSPNIRTQVYCYGIREGGADEWDFGLAKYIESTDSAEKSKWLFALSCSREPWILNRYLSYMLNQDVVRQQDASYVIRYTAQNYVGRALAWDYLRSNWDEIFEYFGGGSFSFSSIISDVTSQFNTEFDLEELKSFGEGRDFGSATRAYEQAIDQTEINIEWMTKNAETVATSLADSVGQLGC